MIVLIACVGKNYELGKDNKLIFNLGDDKAFFLRKTLFKSVLMGRKTYESIGHGLEGRINYVVTSRNDIHDPEIQIIPDVADFLETYRALEYTAHAPHDIFVIGGASVYKQALPYADVIYLTEVDADAEADTYFPEFDKSQYRREVLAWGGEMGIKFEIVKYERRKISEVIGNIHEEDKLVDFDHIKGGEDE